MDECEQPEHRLRQNRQPAVVDSQLQPFVQLFELRLDFRADEQLSGERLGSARLDGALRADDARNHRVPLHLDAVDVRGTGLGNDGAEKVVLNRGHPAIRRRKLDRPLFLQVVALEFFGLVAVVDLRPVERIRVDVEHRAIDTLRAPQQLRVLVAAPGFAAVVDEGLLDPDRVAAAADDEALLDGHAALVGPRQRHREVVRIPQRVLAARRGEERVLVRGGAGRAAQARTNQAEVAVLRAQELDEFVGTVFLYRVTEHRRPHERAAARRNLQFEDIGTHRDGCRLGGRCRGVASR